MLRPITWTGSCVRLLDQTRLPNETSYVDITDEKQMHDAIRRLVVRGAPAIGVAAAFGVYLGVKDFRPADGALMPVDARFSGLGPTAGPAYASTWWSGVGFESCALTNLSPGSGYFIINNVVYKQAQILDVTPAMFKTVFARVRADLDQRR